VSTRRGGGPQGLPHDRRVGAEPVEERGVSEREGSQRERGETRAESTEGRGRLRPRSVV